MTETEQREYEALNQQYAATPQRMSHGDLQRLNDLLSHVIADPETSALERFLSSLVRLSLASWLLNHCDRPPGAP